LALLESLSPLTMAATLTSFNCGPSEPRLPSASHPGGSQFGAGDSDIELLPVCIVASVRSHIVGMVTLCSATMTATGAGATMHHRYF
jgi:hypothetical protein